MKKVHKDRLLKLADFLDVLSPTKFNLRLIVKPDNGVYPSSKTIQQKDCGAVACAIGYCPVVFRDVKYDKTYQLVTFPTEGEDVFERSDFMGACKFFDIEYEDSLYLFIPNAYHKSKRGPKAVAARIRFFVLADGKVRHDTAAYQREYD